MQSISDTKRDESASVQLSDGWWAVDDGDEHYGRPVKVIQGHGGWKNRSGVRYTCGGVHFREAESSNPAPSVALLSATTEAFRLPMNGSGVDNYFSFYLTEIN